jgi:hypothetical protein
MRIDPSRRLTKTERLSESLTKSCGRLGSQDLALLAERGGTTPSRFLMLTPGAEIAAAIAAEEQEVSASAAGAMRMLPEAFLVAAASRRSR